MHNLVKRIDGNHPDDFVGYVCGHCGTKVAGAAIGSVDGSHDYTVFLVCPHCMRGSVLLKRADQLFPGVKYGPAIEGLPPLLVTAYDEARNCMSVNAFVAAELLCRKILMHIAVDKGAPERESFASYLDFLERQGFITPPIKSWAGRIRLNANEATHTISEVTRERAESTVMFTAELLRLVYEMDYLNSQFADGST